MNQIINFPKVTFHKSELIINENTSLEEWKELGCGLIRLEKGVQFWIGDWARFGKKKGYTSSQVYDELEEITGLARQTIKDYRWVADNVPSSLRKDDLSFSHHKEVASLSQENQIKLLEQSVKEKLSVRDLKTIAAEVEWREHWVNMPEFNNQDLSPDSSMIINFPSPEQRVEFAKLIGQKITPKTRSIWFPPQPIDSTKDLRWVDCCQIEPKSSTGQVWPDEKAKAYKDATTELLARPECTNVRIHVAPEVFASWGGKQHCIMVINAEHPLTGKDVEIIFACDEDQLKSKISFSFSPQAAGASVQDNLVGVQCN